MCKRVSAVLMVCFLVISLSVVTAIAGFFGSHKKVKDNDGEVVIPVSSINDSKAHYYVYRTPEQEVKFFVVKSTDGVIRAAYDACDVCFHAKKGYTQDGEFMTCNNCGRKFHSNRINIVQGGCNPAPLKRIERGDSLVIHVSDILQGAKYF